MELTWTRQTNRPQTHFPLAILACALLGLAIPSRQARADQTPTVQTVPDTPAAATPGTPPASDGSASPSPRRYRVFSQEIVDIGVSYDLNPGDHRAIVSGTVSTLFYIGPEFGVNVRTAGSGYVTAGIMRNIWINKPIIRAAFGYQGKRTFIEAGIIGFAGSANTSEVSVSGRFIPLVAVGMRF